ncbi:hypothetical protein AGMMS49938_02040 [Fibrobacterales bacterium]|nr:hypothetical protein AGMMS49938_02040 [Fibrobacterales bacterium]
MNTDNEAQARLKINKMLEDSGWRLLDAGKQKRNVDVEHKGDNGVLDYLLFDSKNFPLCVLEAKKPSINPLSAKDQARRYAESQNIRFVILSNGDISYLWDIKNGNPQIITSIPTQESLEARTHFRREVRALSSEVITPEYVSDSERILRPYQIEAIKAIQTAAITGSDRFLIEMATGLGKTLTAAAIIQMFLRTGNLY